MIDKNLEPLIHRTTDTLALLLNNLGEEESIQFLLEMRKNFNDRIAIFKKWKSAYESGEMTENKK